MICKKQIKIFSLLTVLCLTFCLIVQPALASTVIGSFEVEPNDSYNDANIIRAGSPFLGKLSSGSDLDYYSYRCTEPSNLSLLFIPQSSNTVNYYTVIWDMTSGAIVREGYLANIGQSETYSFTGVANHEYLFLVSGDRASDTYYQAALYSTPSRVSIQNMESEPNNSYEEANIIKSGTPFVGKLSSSDDIDYFSFKNTSNSNLRLLFIPQSSNTVNYYTVIWDITTGSIVREGYLANKGQSETYSFTGVADHEYLFAVAGDRASDTYYQAALYVD